MIGPLLAARIRNKLGINSLEEVYAAAYDGRLQRIAGVGRMRVQAIRESLAVRLDRQSPTWRQIVPSDEPPVETLLEIDRLYRERAAQGRLLTVAPHKFNPTGAAWLPILRITRHGHRYCAAFANTARSHQLGNDRDWVVIYRETKADFGIWTVLTSRYGELRGKRIVRGREAECQAYYDDGRPVQLSMLAPEPVICRFGRAIAAIYDELPVTPKVSVSIMTPIRLTLPKIARKCFLDSNISSGARVTAFEEIAMAVNTQVIVDHWDEIRERAAGTLGEPDRRRSANGPRQHQRIYRPDPTSHRRSTVRHPTVLESSGGRRLRVGLAGERAGSRVCLVGRG